MAPTTPQRWRWLFGGTLNMVSAALNVAAGKICGKDLLSPPRRLLWPAGLERCVLIYTLVYYFKKKGKREK
uniref:Uncharacterized protein n=1 Tax=Anopheles darlingi TaxID=43151 RepID=A0A2M4DHX4_ANODA